MGIHTLHVEHLVLLAIYTLLTVVNSMFYRGMKGIHWFSLYSLFALLGAVAVALRGHLPDFVSIVVGNLFVVAGYLFLLRSLEELLERRSSQVYTQLVLVGMAVVTMLEYGWLHPDTTARLIAYSVVLALQQAQIAWFIFRPRAGGLRSVSAPMGIILAALSITNIVRIVGLLRHGAPQDYLAAGPFLSWIVLANTCLQCGAMVAYVWLTAALLRRDLELQASTDPLTGLLNRRAMTLATNRWIAACRRRDEPLCGVTLDLNGFKQINDSFGHSCGDAALIAVAGCLERSMRADDLLARLGGDEFGILLPRTSLGDAAAIAERLRSSIQELEIVHGEVRTSITASVGLAEMQSEMSTWEQLARRCDHSLYAVKRAGKNLTLDTHMPIY